MNQRERKINYEKIIITDLDGVIFERLFPVQYFALWDRFVRNKNIYQPLPSFPGKGIENSKDTIWKIQDTPIASWQENLSLETQRRRPLKTGVAESIALIADHNRPDGKKVKLVGNTGRNGTKTWESMTREALLKKNIFQYFDDVFYKPPGMNSVESKAGVVGMFYGNYKNMLVLDDNPADVLPMAHLFPDAQFIIIQDLSTGILFSRIEMEQYPKVRRVASFQEAVADFLPKSN